MKKAEILRQTMNGRNCADNADFVTAMEITAHDMNLFLSTKSKAGHDCVPLAGIVAADARTFLSLPEYAFTLLGLLSVFCCFRRVGYGFGFQLSYQIIDFTDMGAIDTG